MVDVTKLPQIKLVSWDVDGTLYSINRMKWRLMRRFLVEVAGRRGLKARRELAMLMRYRAQVNTARPNGGELAENFLEQNGREDVLEVEKRWYGLAIQQAGPRAGVNSVMAFLAESGIPQVVISDYEAKYKLDSLGLAGRFSSIYVGERLGFVKPSPVLFQRAAADFRTSTANLLHLGDRADRDDAAARAAGCQCLILGRDFQHFDGLLAALSAVPKDHFNENP